MLASSSQKTWKPSANHLLRLFLVILNQKTLKGTKFPNLELSHANTLIGERSCRVNYQIQLTHPLWWQLLNWIVDPLGFQEKYSQKYGDIFTMRLSGLGSFVVIGNPHIIDTENGSDNLHAAKLFQQVPDIQFAWIDGADYVPTRTHLQLNSSLGYNLVKNKAVYLVMIVLFSQGYLDACDSWHYLKLPSRIFLKCRRIAD